MFAKKILALAVLVTVVACFSVPASAQLMDYGALEELFGEAVTTSATGQPQRASDVPVTMTIITSDEIRRSGAADIPEVLRKKAGINVWRWTRLQNEVSVRGYNSAYAKRLLVLINGRQAYDDDYGHVAWESLPVQLDEIRQIEIVKGPNSALFGFNAVSGVVNIITYNPLYDDVSGAGVRVGSDNYRQGYAVYTARTPDKFGIRFSGGKIKTDDFSPPAGTVFTDPSQWAFSLDGVLQMTEKSHLRVEASRTSSLMTRYAPTYVASTSNHNKESVKLTYAASMGQNGLFQGTLYHNKNEVIGTSAAGLRLNNAVTVAQAEYLLKAAANHNLRIQGEYRHNTLNGAFLLTPGSEISYDVYAGSGMWNWALRENLTWTNALRLDHLVLERTGPLTPNSIIASNAAFNRDMTEYSYNSGLVWRATEKDTLRLTSARGIQAPGLLELGQTLTFPGPPPFGTVIIGNPNLEAAVITNHEIGHDRAIDKIAGGARLAVFHQKTEDIHGASAITVVATSQSGSIGSSTSVGAEIEFYGKVGQHWNWDTNYTFQHVNDRLTANAGAITIPYNGEQATPSHIMNAHLGFADGPWEADIYTQYVSGYQVLANLAGGGGPYTPIKSGNFISFAGRVGFDINDHVTLSLSGQELNRSSVRETSATKKERQIFLSLTSSF